MSFYSFCTLILYKDKQKVCISKLLKHTKFGSKFPVTLLRNVQSNSDPDTLRIEPQGYDTGICLYNTLSKSKVPFKTLSPRFVSWYNCGPTVYDSAHIGHASCYVKLDIIRRIMQDFFQLKVVKATGVTNIDDKIIARSKALNISVESVTQKYEKEFFEDLSKLNVLPSSVTPRVTDHIPQIISFVSKILENGHAYPVGKGTVYFDTLSYGCRGKLVKQIENAVPRIIPDPRKKSMRDFALWKEATDEDPVAWDSPWGLGRPGWHIECSAMASHIFGERLDLHSGGMDLIFPHHENEEAQCCSHHRCDQWCNYWIHTGHLYAKDSTKMSKSLQNTISIEDFLREHSSNAFRLFCLFSHYRSSIEYNSESVSGAESNLKKLVSFFQDSLAYIDGNTNSAPLDDNLIFERLMETEIKVRSCLADDFNTKEAMLSLFELVAVCNKQMDKGSRAVRVGRSVGTLVAVRDYAQSLLTTLGLKFDKQLPVEVDNMTQNQSFVQIVDSSLNFRQTVRDFALLKDQKGTQSLSKEELKSVTEERAPLLGACDKFRSDLAQAGIKLKDYSGKTSWNFEKKKPATASSEEADFVKR